MRRRLQRNLAHRALAERRDPFQGLRRGVPLPVEESVFLAAALAAVGDRDRALRVLERARPRGAHLFSDMQTSDLEMLRADPRFQRLASESRPATR